MSRKPAVPKRVRDILANNDQIRVIDGDGFIGDTGIILPTAAKKPRTEYDFEHDYLEPRLETGASVFWLAQPSIRMIGQTVTGDYFELTADGYCNFYEVKGSFSLGSESRASVKLRWAQSHYGTDRIRFFWARQGKDKKWKIRQIKTKREEPR